MQKNEKTKTFEKSWRRKIEKLERDLKKYSNLKSFFDGGLYFYYIYFLRYYMKIKKNKRAEEKYIYISLRKLEKWLYEEIGVYKSYSNWSLKLNVLVFLGLVEKKAGNEVKDKRYKGMIKKIYSDTQKRLATKKKRKIYINYINFFSVKKINAKVMVEAEERAKFLKENKFSYSKFSKYYLEFLAGEEEAKKVFCNDTRTIEQSDQTKEKIKMILANFQNLMIEKGITNNEEMRAKIGRIMKKKDFEDTIKKYKKIFLNDNFLKMKRKRNSV